MKTLVTLLFCLGLFPLAAQPPPNIIVMFIDDMGVNDIGAYTYPSKAKPGPPPAAAPSPDKHLPPPNSARDANAAGLSITPHIDSLAEDGVRFTSFYAAHSVCSPTRASLLTGSYAARVGLEGVVGPYGDGPAGKESTGLNSTEITLPELLRVKGYATGISGKWHLGHRRDFNPIRHGFERYFGILYSNDMWANHPCSNMNWGDLALMSNEIALDTYTTNTGRNITGPINTDEEQSYLLEAMTYEAMDFIDRSVVSGKPFFLFYSPHAPHIPIHPHPDYLSVAGRTDDVARYYDLIREIDARVGDILKCLETHGIANNTIVMFTSDNGPWQDRPGAGNLEQGAGSAYPFRGAKNSTCEGGHRVPFIARFPGRIPAGSVRDQLGVTFDLFTTLALQAGVALPTDRVIDGRDIWPLLSGSHAGEISDKFYYYDAGKPAAEGILDLTTADRWKLVSGSTSPAHDGLFRIGRGFCGDFQEAHDISEANSNISSALAGQLMQWNNQMTRRPKGLARPVSIELENDSVTVDEQGTAITRIRLSAAADVTVNLARFFGDRNFVTSKGASLTFTSGNWNTWQTVEFAFQGDPDLISQSAVFRASSVSLHVREIFVFKNE